VGKTVGIFGSTFLVARFTRARLDDDLRWIDVLGISMLSGIGFTVSLLIGDLAYGADGTREEHVKLGVLCGSLLAALLAALAPIAAVAALVRRRRTWWWALLPLAAATWALVHASGVHATVAGVLLGFTVPVVRYRAAGGPDAGPGLAEHFEHRIRPLSASLAVPIFAFFAAGVASGGVAGLTESLSDPIALGIVAGLVLGKPVGILGTAWLTARFTHASLDDELSWLDVLGVSLLGGIGFTVSLLIGELAFGLDSVATEHVKVGILTGSLVAALVAGLLVKTRDRTYRRIAVAEAVDSDADGVPDVYEHRREPGDDG
jgi:NhaA family Na+:H+ antiporter